jgi:hypothetical protein
LRVSRPVSLARTRRIGAVAYCRESQFVGRACDRRAVATLTYVYADQTAVLGPLSVHAEPHAYDLCEPHRERLSAPRGWSVLRLAVDAADDGPSGDDLLALADAVREAAKPVEPTPDSRPTGGTGPGREPRHLRVLSFE